MSGAEAALKAARLGDEVVHGFGLLGMVAGALIGAVVAAAIVAAGVATGGLLIVAIVGGCIAGGGLAGGAIARGLMKAADLPGPTTGVLAAAGPSRVTVNSRMALRAGLDFSAGCSGAPMNHFPMPGPVLIAQGSKTVTVNGMPMARQSMKLVCGAQIKSGSHNVTVGGPTATVAAIDDNEAQFEMFLQVLGGAALLAGGAAALAAGLGATLVFGAVVGGSMYGMEKLHEWGESLGPGYGDIMVGVAGFALMAAGAKLAGRAKNKTAANLSDDAAQYEYSISKVPKDLAEDPRGVYGYLPKEESQFHSSRWPVDWSNGEQVAAARVTRLDYHKGLKGERAWVEQMRSQGHSDEEIAAQLVDMRNKARLSHYDESNLEVVYRRNQEKYGNKYGPTYASQLDKYGSPAAVIEAATRSNATMDVLTGIAKIKQ